MRLGCLCLFVCLADALMQGTQLVVHLTHPHIYTAGYELIGRRLVKQFNVNVKWKAEKSFDTFSFCLSFFWLFDIWIIMQCEIKEAMTSVPHGLLGLSHRLSLFFPYHSGTRYFTPPPLCPDVLLHISSPSFHLFRPLLHFTSHFSLHGLSLNSFAFTLPSPCPPHPPYTLSSVLPFHIFPPPISLPPPPPYFFSIHTKATWRVCF